MTFNTRTVSCDGAGCDADGLDPSDVSTIPLRLRPYNDPHPYLEPVEKEIHLCHARCLNGIHVDESSIVWIAYNQFDDDGGSVEGIRREVRRGMGDSGTYEEYDDRGSFVLGRIEENLFEIVEEAIDSYTGVIPMRGGDR